MELHAEQRSLAIFHRRDGDLIGVSRHAETLRGIRHRVAVAHPDPVLARKVSEYLAGCIDVDPGGAVLALSRRLHPASERLRHQLMPVADPKYGHVHPEEIR